MTNIINQPSSRQGHQMVNKNNFRFLDRNFITYSNNQRSETECHNCHNHRLHKCHHDQLRRCSNFSTTADNQHALAVTASSDANHRMTASSEFNPKMTGNRRSLTHRAVIKRSPRLDQLSMLCHIIVIFVSLFSRGSCQNVAAASSSQLNDCSWQSDDSRLSCFLKTLQSSPTLISQVANSKIVDIHCSEEFLYESIIQRDHFGAVPSLHDLTLRHCKIKTLPDGAFSGLNNLQRLVIQGYNSEWSNSLKMDVSSRSLDKLAALEHLDLSWNNLWGLPPDLLCPVSGKLKSLNLTRNNIVEVSEVGLGERSARSNQGGCQLYNLKLVDLSYNKISSFRGGDLAHSPNIRELRLRGNKLTVLADAALAGLPALVSLDLAENRLAAIPPAVFMPVPALERLFLENNSLAILTAETFTPLDNLLQLNLSANALTSNIVAGDIFYPLTKLVALDLSHNKITSIPDSMFRQQVVLQILNLSHNKISSIAEGSLQALANLHILLLSYNLLSTLPPTILHSLPSLKSLSLDHNQLIRLPEQLFTSSPHLQDLSLNQNRLEQIPAGIDQLVSIRTLDLGENRIADFSTSSMDDPNGGKLSDERNAASKVFHRLSALYGLRLAGNRLTEIPAQIFQANSNLHVLNLAHNSLANISRESFQKLNNLRALRLDNNNLTNINGLVGSLKNLKWLNVSENELQWFDFAFIPKSLEWLDVHNNNIDTIGNYYNLGDGFSLKTFDASYNRIETLSSDTLLHSLHSIYLNNNRIKSVAAGSFRELSQLRRVELQDNQLAHLEMSAVELSYAGESAPEFLVGGNPWSCDCELEWLKNVNQLRGTGSYPRILDLDTIMCSTTSSSSSFLMSSSPSSFPPPRQDSSSYNNNNHVTVQQQNGSSSVPLLHMRSDQFVCEYDAHCIPQCYCCDFFACDCRMQCPEGCSCYHDNSWTNNVIQCSGRGHMDVPPLIPMDATAVYLDGNNMTELANPGFIGRRRVRAVYLNNSMIVRVTNYSFEGLTEVSVLHLEDNQIKTLAGNEFTGLAKLQQLYLQNNFLTSIAAQTFAGLRDLTVLRLDGNLLTSFPVWQLNNPLLSHLYLGRNSWTCECEYVRPFLQFRQKFAGKIVDLTESSVKCVTTAGAEALSVMSTVACTTSGVLQPSTTSSSGGGGTTVSTTGSITDYTPILVSVLLVVLILVIGYLLTFTFRKTIRSWFVGGVSKTRRSAAGTAVSGMSAIAGTATGDRACSDNNAGSVYSTSNDKLFDVFISYAPEDGDLVEGSLAANLEHGATSYRLCLHQRDFPPTTPLADTVSVAVETSTRAVIVLSRAYLATQWVNIRPSFMKAIKDNNTKVVFIQVEQQLDADHAVDDLLSAAPELRNLREDSPCVHWQDPNFWSKLRYFLPEPVYLTFHRSVTMRGTLQQQQQNPAAGNLYQPVMPYPARIELLATNYINSGHNCVETDHSTDTTTMTAVSPLHSVYAVSGGGGTAGSEHTYHSIDNNHIYHTLDPGPPSAATANLFHLQFHHSSTPVAAAGQPAARSSPGFPAHVLDAGLQPPALHHNNRSSTAHHQHHHGSHTPSNSTCSAKRLLSGDQGEYIV